jgi:hypothetical protein
MGYDLHRAPEGDWIMECFLNQSLLAIGLEVLVLFVVT